MVDACFLGSDLYRSGQCCCPLLEFLGFFFGKVHVHPGAGEAPYPGSKVAFDKSPQTGPIDTTRGVNGVVIARFKPANEKSDIFIQISNASNLGKANSLNAGQSAFAGGAEFGHLASNEYGAGSFSGPMNASFQVFRPARRRISSPSRWRYSPSGRD